MLSVGALYVIFGVLLTVHFFLSALKVYSAWMSKSGDEAQGNERQSSIVFVQEDGATEPLIESNEEHARRRVFSTFTHLGL